MKIPMLSKTRQALPDQIGDLGKFVGYHDSRFSHRANLSRGAAARAFDQGSSVAKTDSLILICKAPRYEGNKMQPRPMRPHMIGESFFHASSGLAEEDKGPGFHVCFIERKQVEEC